MKFALLSKVLREIVAILFFATFLFSCGLDDVVTVESPTITYHDPLYSNSDYLTHYFDFLSADDSGDSFMGTEVYYKIYNNSSTLVTERDSINSVNTATNSSAAATRMIDTYTYQPLGTSPQNGKSIFVDSKNSVRITLRLKSYKGNENHEGSDWHNFRAGIDGYTYNYTQVVPFRSGNQKSFDFFDDDDNDVNGTRDVEPVESDPDYKHSSSASASDTYYVQLFAVGVAYDQTTLSNAYSLVLDLGSVSIKKEK